MQYVNSVKICLLHLTNNYLLLSTPLDNSYSFATDGKDTQNRNRNRDSNKKRKTTNNKGSNSPYYQDENSGRWKTTDAKYNSKRRQKSFVPDERKVITHLLFKFHSILRLKKIYGVGHS